MLPGLHLHLAIRQMLSHSKNGKITFDVLQAAAAATTAIRASACTSSTSVFCNRLHSDIFLPAVHGRKASMRLLLIPIRSYYGRGMYCTLQLSVGAMALFTLRTFARWRLDLLSRQRARNLRPCPPSSPHLALPPPIPCRYITWIQGMFPSNSQGKLVSVLERWVLLSASLGAMLPMLSGPHVHARNRAHR